MIAMMWIKFEEALLKKNYLRGSIVILYCCGCCFSRRFFLGVKYACSNFSPTFHGLVHTF